MSDTFHIKRWKERFGLPFESWSYPVWAERTEAMLDDLAHHTETLFDQLRAEHERNNQLEEKLNALISIVRQASFPPGVFDKVHKLFESSRNEFFKSVKEEGDLPKGENN